MVSLLLLCLNIPGSAKNNLGARYWVVVAASSRHERSEINSLGMAIEEVRNYKVAGSCDRKTLNRLKQKGFKILQEKSLRFMAQAFPPQDEAYHDYHELTQELQSLVSANHTLASFYSIGPSLLGKAIWVIRLNTTEKNNALSPKPGIVFMGTHHAREHLSAEIPILLAKYLATHSNSDPELKALMDTRDIFIIPMVNPDGEEHDHDRENQEYRMWRKNMKEEGQDQDNIGVDLNRNYGYHWGQEGASPDSESETYRGANAFSEPETQAIKEFIETHKNIKILLSFHTYSELILYPWGYTYDPVADNRDYRVFVQMARTMAQWNGYTPQQSSELYITSGDTTDWAYGQHKIFAFTFELTPASMSEGGFYPGPGVIDSTFNANLKPCLYLIAAAANPYGVLP